MAVAEVSPKLLKSSLGELQKQFEQVEQDPLCAARQHVEMYRDTDDAREIYLSQGSQDHTRPLIQHRNFWSHYTY